MADRKIRILPRKSIAERFWPKVKVGTPDECWPWLAAKQRNGYGCIGRGGKYGGMYRAHRVSYELAYGPIPKGLTIDHLCKRRDCVNPAHLEAVTIQVNLLRGDTVTRRNASKATCPRGHAYTHRNVRGDRTCRVCDNTQAAKYRALRKSRGYKRPSQATGKPRGARGERNGSAKLTTSNVTDIRNALARGELRSSLASQYGVAWPTIDRIAKGVSWAKTN